MESGRSAGEPRPSPVTHPIGTARPSQSRAETETPAGFLARDRPLSASTAAPLSGPRRLGTVGRFHAAAPRLRKSPTRFSTRHIRRTEISSPPPSGRIRWRV